MYLLNKEIFSKKKLQIEAEPSQLKGTLSRVDMRRSVHPRRLKKFSLRDKYVYGFSTTLSCIPLCHHTFFSVPSCSFSRRVWSPRVDAILKVRVFNLKTSG